MEDSDNFERMLDFCFNEVYKKLKEEKEYLRRKLIDKSFSDDILDIISALYKMRA